MRHPARAALVLVAAAMHGAALWLLVIATRPHERADGPARGITMVGVMQAPSAMAEPPVQRAPRSTIRTDARRLPTTTVRSHAITAPDLRPEPPATPTAAAALTQADRPAPRAPPLILDSASTRRALREIGRESAVVERANQDLDNHPHPAFDSRWSAGVAGAARGDCRKGEFRGSGMGLLSLPALALAAAKGDCGR